MNILAIDTSNQPMSIAIYENHKPLGELTWNVKRTHSVQLMPSIQYMLNEVKLKPNDLDKIIVANGPGSYTGLRIGMTTAKTLAWTLKIPLVMISSLELLAANVIYSNGLVCPFFDARRGNVFTGLYRANMGNLTVEESDTNVSMDEWLTHLQTYDEPIMFVSSTAHQLKEVVNQKLGDQAKWVEGHFSMPHAGQLVLLGKDRDGVDVHTASPNYHRLVEAEAKWREKKKNGNG